MNRNLLWTRWKCEDQAHQSWKSVAELGDGADHGAAAEPAEHANQHPARTGADVGRRWTTLAGRLRMQLQASNSASVAPRPLGMRMSPQVTQTRIIRWNWCRCRRPHGCWPTLWGRFALLGTCFEAGTAVALSQGAGAIEALRCGQRVVTYWPWEREAQDEPPALRIDPSFWAVVCAWKWRCRRRTARRDAAAGFGVDGGTASGSGRLDVA